MRRVPFSECSNSKAVSGSHLNATKRAEPENKHKMSCGAESPPSQMEAPPTQNDSLVARMAGPSSGKAGLGSCDKDAINKKIYELSKAILTF